MRVWVHRCTAAFVLTRSKRVLEDTSEATTHPIHPHFFWTDLFVKKPGVELQVVCVLKRSARHITTHRSVSSEGVKYFCQMLFVGENLEKIYSSFVWDTAIDRIAVPPYCMQPHRWAIWSTWSSRIQQEYCHFLMFGRNSFLANPKMMVCFCCMLCVPFLWEIKISYVWYQYLKKRVLQKSICPGRHVGNMCPALSDVSKWCVKRTLETEIEMIWTSVLSKKVVIDKW